MISIMSQFLPAVNGVDAPERRHAAFSGDATQLAFAGVLYCSLSGHGCLGINELANGPSLGSSVFGECAGYVAQSYEYASPTQ